MSPLASPEPIRQRLAAARSVLITSHVSPDGDAVGSSLALARVCQNAGKEAVVWLLDPPPRILEVLPGAEKIHRGTEPPTGFPLRFDLGVLLECPSIERCGLETAVSRLPLLNIDHHLGNTEYGEAIWVEPKAAAVAILVLELARALGWSIDGETANALYLALVTDTGGFRYSNANPDAFEAAAELVRLGAEPSVVSKWLYESQPVEAVRLVAESLRTLELHHGGRVATIRLTTEMMNRAGAGPGDSEGLIDFPRSIAGVDAVALFRQVDDELTKVSLRSRGKIDVERVAHTFGGGGHHNAAGFKSRTPYASLFQETVQALGAALNEDP